MNATADTVGSPDAPAHSRMDPRDRFVDRLRCSLDDDSFVRLVLSNPGAETAPVARIEARCILLHDKPTLSITLHEATRDTVRNVPVGEAAEWFRSGPAAQFQAALLETTRRDWQLSLGPGRAPRLVAHTPRTREAPPRAHDRSKATALPPSTRDWLHALGICDRNGRPFPSQTDKLRQITRFTEILRHLVADGLPDAKAPLQVADMACGKGYLTFAAWQLLRRDLGVAAEVVGIEARPELAASASAIAGQLGLDGLRFTPGTIASFPVQRLDILLALHACDTATDDAIRRGIEAGASLIAVAPCCHKELRPQLGQPEPLAPVLRHGLMAGRFAEWATDGLRALFLEWAGYRVKAIEFVDPDHTPRNLLLAAIREGAPFGDPAAKERILAFKRFIGVERHALDPLLDG